MLNNKLELRINSKIKSFNLLCANSIFELKSRFWF